MELKRFTEKERDAYIKGQYAMADAIKSKINLMDIADKAKVLQMIDEFTAILQIFHNGLKG